MSSENLVTLGQLAKKLGMDKSGLRKFVLEELGITPSWCRTQASGNQKESALTDDEAERVIRERIERGFTVRSLPSEPLGIDIGTFYVIQLIPEYNTNRVKFGFAINLEDRLRRHRTAAPTAKVVKAWPCKRSWEKAATDCMTAEGCTLVSNEVFECDDLEKVLRKGEAFFAMLPKVPM